jgi:predicted nucleic acid-binding protein
VQIVVSDTSPIRALVHLQHLEVLRELFGEVLIPPAVAAELERPRSRLLPVRLDAFPFVHIQRPQHRNVIDELLVSLGPGEAEAIALALETGIEIVLVDETAGRAAAIRRGLHPVGVLGVLLQARRRKLIGPLKPLLDRLEGELNFFIAPSPRLEVLDLAGEG